MTVGVVTHGRMPAERIASGWDVVTVQRASGLASAATTLNTYGHLWPTAEDRTRRAAVQLFAIGCGLRSDPSTGR